MISSTISLACCINKMKSIMGKKVLKKDHARWNVKIQPSPHRCEDTEGAWLWVGDVCITSYRMSSSPGPEGAHKWGPTFLSQHWSEHLCVSKIDSCGLPSSGRVGWEQLCEKEAFSGASLAVALQLGERTGRPRLWKHLWHSDSLFLS
jgi:hypothetical protein